MQEKEIHLKLSYVDVSSHPRLKGCAHSTIAAAIAKNGLYGIQWKCSHGAISTHKIPYSVLVLINKHSRNGTV